MAKFTSKKVDLVVSVTEGVYIKFKNGKYTATKKAEIEALRKALDVTEIKATPRARTVTDVLE